MDSPPYDALLIVSFGGPERRDDVLPFLENVLRGKPVPRERMLAVAEHYYELGGVSPINAQNRALIAALERELAEHGPRLPIYWGNRNWHPLLVDTLRQMESDGIHRALAFFTSAYSSYSGCRQYLENIAAAQAEVGPAAPRIDKLRAFFNHPGFIEPMIESTRAALEQIPPDRRVAAELIFTAHSIPLAMADGCQYENQLREASRLVAAGVGHPQWELVYQSRSGPPNQPWLEPDVRDWLRTARAAGVRDVVLVPIGFISDHLEVIYDLDIEAQQSCARSGLNMVRAATVGHASAASMHMTRELVVELNDGSSGAAEPIWCPGDPRPPATTLVLLDCCLLAQKAGDLPQRHKGH